MIPIVIFYPTDSSIVEFSTKDFDINYFACDWLWIFCGADFHEEQERETSQVSQQWSI